jgi:hypothetical protein
MPFVVRKGCFTPLYSIGALAARVLSFLFLSPSLAIVTRFKELQPNTHEGVDRWTCNTNIQELKLGSYTEFRGHPHGVRSINVPPIVMNAPYSCKLGLYCYLILLFCRSDY